MWGGPKDDDVVIEASNEDKSSGTKSNHTLLSHRRVLDSRNPSQAQARTAGALASQDNLGVPSEVSLSESELKNSVRLGLLSQKHRPARENAQATVMQQRMEMMPKLHRNMLLKKA